MLIRVIVDLCFKNEADAQAIFDEVKAKMSKAVKLRVNDPSIGNEHITFAEIHKCYHDEHPFKPCEVIERIEA